MSAQGIEILKIFRSKVLFLTMAADLANHELEGRNNRAKMLASGQHEWRHALLARS